jgi:diguanylate cyclase (GGDEF)-like protein
MAGMGWLSWARIGPREDERVLAGKVAGALWLMVLPMIAIGLFLPGTEKHHWPVLVGLTIPTAAWGIACLFLIDWRRVPTPLVFHIPAFLALPYIAVLVASTGVAHSPFALTLLMLLSFCAYFFPPRIAIGYIVGCVVVQALPALYDPNAVGSGLLAQVWIATLVYVSVGSVIVIGKRELLALRDAAHELSLKDSLTGLANRRALERLFEQNALAGRRESLGLLLIDLDDFKEANTLHGLPGGDRVLCAVAEALQRVARPGDEVIRLGGDEFAIVAMGLSNRGMRRLAGRTLQEVRDAGIDLDLQGVRPTASVGWATMPDDADSADELMTVADLALRGAKMTGKNSALAPLDWVPELAPQTGLPEASTS